MDEANERLAMANQRLIEARRSADEARQIKARFAANISHELRTPLNLIVGFTEVMYNTPYVYQDVLLSPEFLLDLGAVYRNAQHLQRLVDDVLDLAQIDTGKIVLQLAEVDMASLVREAADTVHNLATVRGLSVVTEVSPDLPHVYADRTRVKQVLLNLLSNAIRYTESGTVTVKASCNDHEVLCSVTDTGPGIPEEEQKKLFREFERVSTGQASPQRGFGLGLAISKRFIQALGGRIWVESQVGLGSTFTFALPVLYEAPWSNVSEVTTVQPSLLPQQAAKDLVLVVTSNLLAARLFSRYLENYRCLTSRNVSQVQRQIADLQPRGILTDEASGAAIVDQLGRALEETPVLKTPLIVCPMPGEPQIGSLRQAKAYLVKPVTRQDLLDTLRTFGEQIETILVVDDEDDALRLFSHYLQDDVVRPYKVIIAHNGREALGAMSRTMPDLILLDLLMPIMDGYRFLEEIQANPSWADIPVVLVSSRDAQDQRQPIEGWVKARVPRGMDASQLIRAVDDLIRALQPSTRNGS
jgi:CheY-like chemotaxis protein/nitrogen-specific signal transduction histidine kinase